MVTKPRRADVFAMTGDNKRLTDAIMSLFESAESVTEGGMEFAAQVLSNVSQVISDQMQPIIIAQIEAQLEQATQPPQAYLSLASEAPDNGALLQYSEASQTWEPVTGATGSFTALTGEVVTVTNGLITQIT